MSQNESVTFSSQKMSQNVGVTFVTGVLALAVKCDIFNSENVTKTLVVIGDQSQHGVWGGRVFQFPLRGFRYRPFLVSVTTPSFRYNPSPSKTITSVGKCAVGFFFQNLDIFDVLGPNTSKMSKL